MEPKAVVCKIICTDGSVYDIRAVVRGHILEANENLSSAPSLISAHVRNRL